MDVTMTISKTASGLDRAVMNLSGSASVQGGEEFRSALLTALAADELLLTFDGLTDADPAILQLVWSALKTAEATGRNMALSPEPPAVFIEAGRGAGFSSFGAIETGNSRTEEEQPS